MVQVFRWAGMDLAQRRVMLQEGRHDNNEPDTTGDPSSQLNADTRMFVFLPMAAMYHGNISNGNSQASRT